MQLETEQLKDPEIEEDIDPKILENKDEKLLVLEDEIVNEDIKNQRDIEKAEQLKNDANKLV